MKQKYIWIAAAAAAVIGLGLASAYWITPGSAAPQLEEGSICVYTAADGSLSMTWPAAESGADYRISLRGNGETQWREPMHSFEPSIELNGITLPFQARIQALRSGKNLLGMTRELAGRLHEISIPDVSLDSPQLTGNTEVGCLYLSWKAEEAEKGSDTYLYEISRQNPADSADTAAIATVQAESFDLHFGENGDLELPSEGESLQITVRKGLPGKGYILYGPPSEAVAVERDALIGGEMSLTFQETDPGSYVLQWSRTLGAYYELQEWSGGAWETLARVESGKPLQYEIGPLGSGSQHRYQVTACGQDGSVYASAQTDFYASISTQNSTIWPITDLKLYEQPSTSRTKGTIPAGTALRVLEESGQYFQVSYQNSQGYVDSRFCMINLPEYLGDYCNYNITNSYQSIFKVHDYSISQVTNQVIPGYEHIRAQDGSFLVPYLYPSSQKLLTAAKAAIADGYRLKIYEAFRPNQATRFLYDTTMEQLNNPISGGTASMTGSSLQRSQAPEPSAPELETPASSELAPIPEISDLPEVPELPETPDTPDPPPEDPNAVDPPDSSEPTDTSNPPEIPDSTPEVPEPSTSSSDTPDAAPPANTSNSNPHTLGGVMTDNGRFGLNSFLARSISAHNRGIAMDLTLETLDTGEELSMQSRIHDLSWYAATYRNNANAKRLASYMTAAGLNGLSSEWWHFQDDSTRKAIGLNTYLYQGVAACP